jgi:hypothetical protein
LCWKEQKGGIEPAFSQEFHLPHESGASIMKANGVINKNLIEVRIVKQQVLSVGANHRGNMRVREGRTQCPD